MLKDVDYDIIETITVISKSLYRYETYLEDTDKFKCDECRKMWLQFKSTREKELATLLKELKAHVDSGMFSSD
ncbi:MAG: hypothetical protein PHN75_03085 [Syntrophales bacterium]|nr:hypothetical protein [Syntrophales bacterium]